MKISQVNPRKIAIGVLTFIGICFLIGMFSCGKPLVTEEQHNRQIDSIKIMVNLLEQKFNELADRKNKRDTLIINSIKTIAHEEKQVDNFTRSDFEHFWDSTFRANNIH